MMYHLLDEVIYRNSRYELIQLLEDICPTKWDKLERTCTFDEMTNDCEFLLDKYFPSLPLSEERLAIFLRVYSDNNLISPSLRQAFESGVRASVFSVLQEVSAAEEQNGISLKRRRYYEADIFGG